MIEIDYNFYNKKYFLKQGGFEKDYLSQKELLGYLNLLNSNCNYIGISPYAKDF